MSIRKEDLTVHHFDGPSPKMFESLWHNRVWQLHRPCFRLLGPSPVEKSKWKWSNESLMAAAQALLPSWHSDRFSTLGWPTELHAGGRIFCGLALSRWYPTHVERNQSVHLGFESQSWARFLGCSPNSTERERGPLGVMLQALPHIQ
jgi:hypothetical protein